MDSASTSVEPELPLAKYKIILIAISVLILLLLVGIRIYSSQSRTKVEFTEVATSSAELTHLLVDVSGAVEHPGVYTLTSDARIQEALLAAGGLSSNADREWVSQHINLASKVIDGAKVYIPKVQEKTAGLPNTQVIGATTNATKNIISINSASAAELDTLPGVGEVTAGKIIAGRPYQKIEELTTKKIVNKSTFEKIKDKISL